MDIFRGESREKNPTKPAVKWAESKRFNHVEKGNRRGMIPVGAGFKLYSQKRQTFLKGSSSPSEGDDAC